MKNIIGRIITFIGIILIIIGIGSADSDCSILIPFAITIIGFITFKLGDKIDER